MSDFLPTASLATLRLRAELLARVRQFFAEQGFLEVETPILSADVTIDRHLDPMSTVLADDPRTPDVGRRLWLQTSPEFGMKRLLAAGATAIYQISRAFRNSEVGLLHNPEFTMVEWYRAGDDMAAGMMLLSEVCQTLLGLQEAERVSFAGAFQRHVGIDPHTATTAELAMAAKQNGIAVPAGLGDDRAGWLNVLLAECVEPHLGQVTPIIVYDYPASQAALAKIRIDERPSMLGSGEVSLSKIRSPYSSPAVAERFELYVRGVELANGYHELLDAAELRRRNAAANAARVAQGKPALPEESRLLAAMESGLPACTGVALGFDRLVMLAAGAKSLAEVLAFSIDRA
ncbi:MAG TPA: EF-P lysine aminoacylase GenX [Pirellulales bacterium]|nr:EF-P lysine aminoacylase GenX [Pirellulales bacterium]